MRIQNFELATDAGSPIIEGALNIPLFLSTFPLLCDWINIQVYFMIQERSIELQSSTSPCFKNLKLSSFSWVDSPLVQRRLLKTLLFVHLYAQRNLCGESNFVRNLLYCAWNLSQFFLCDFIFSTHSSLNDTFLAGNLPAKNMQNLHICSTLHPVSRVFAGSLQKWSEYHIVVFQTLNDVFQRGNSLFLHWTIPLQHLLKSVNNLSRVSFTTSMESYLILRSLLLHPTFYLVLLCFQIYGWYFSSTA